jgi:glycerophosphoryl diester phosphodiesterase
LLLDEKNIIEIQNCDIKIIAWTVNEIEAIEKMKTLKIGGIITDFPDRI